MISQKFRGEFGVFRVEQGKKDILLSNHKNYKAAFASKSNLPPAPAGSRYLIKNQAAKDINLGTIAGDNHE